MVPGVIGGAIVDDQDFDQVCWQRLGLQRIQGVPDERTGVIGCDDHRHHRVVGSAGLLLGNRSWLRRRRQRRCGHVPVTLRRRTRYTVAPPARPIKSGTRSTTGNAPPAVSVVLWATSTFTSGLIFSSSVPFTESPNGTTTTYAANRPELTA